MISPTTDDVYRARRRIDGLIRRTTLMRHPLLVGDGNPTPLTHENHNPPAPSRFGRLKLVAAFQRASARGHHQRGTATTAIGRVRSQRVGVPSRLRFEGTIQEERGHAPYGATWSNREDFDEAREWSARSATATELRSLCERAAADSRRRHHAARFRITDSDVIFVPIGGGSGACGCCSSAAGSEEVARDRGRAGRGPFARSWRGPSE